MDIQNSWSMGMGCFDQANWFVQEFETEANNKSMLALTTHTLKQTVTNRINNTIQKLARSILCQTF